MSSQSISYYPWLSRCFHAIIALAVIANYGLIYFRDSLPKGNSLVGSLMLWHKSIGVLIFALALLFMMWRYVSSRPESPKMNLLEQTAAKLTHLLLWASLFFMPLSGYLMSSFSGRVTPFFNITNLPNPFMKNTDFAAFFHSFHEFWANVLLGLFCLHLVAALYHHFVRKDKVLRQMFH